MGKMLEETLLINGSVAQLDSQKTDKKKKKNKHVKLESVEGKEQNIKRKFEETEVQDDSKREKTKKKKRKEKENGTQQEEHGNQQRNDNETPELEELEQAKGDGDALAVTGKDAQETKYAPLKSFAESNLPDIVLNCCKSFKSTSPIQAHAWPFLLNRRDFIGIAKTGSGTDNERSHIIDSKLQETCTVDENEDAESEDDQEASDLDRDNNLGVNSKTIVKASMAPSSFLEHLGQKISEEEVDNLSNKKWEYKWEEPAVDMSNCKWVGTGKCFLKDVNIDGSYGLKQRLFKHWFNAYKTCGGSDFHSSKQRFFFSLCSSYKDILHCNKKPFYLKGLEEDSSIMDAYIMHSLNHVFRTGDLIRKNDSKMAKHQESAEDELLAGDGFLDHGFTRPKVLILLPFRNIALRVVRRMIQLTPQAYKVNVEHADRFYNDFGTRDDEDTVDGDELAQNVGNSKPLKSSKPSDYQALFSGNYDDDFMIGIKFTRRSIKLYSDFYSSDLIVASPLNLHARIERAILDKETDVDYLSSIEVVVIDHADVITMQNWNFLTKVLGQLNRIPSKQHGTDIMRIRKWYLDGNARFYRQTIILSHYVNQDITVSFNHQCVNYKGKVKLVCEYKGVLSKVLLQVRQVYELFDVNSMASVDDDRLEYFIKKVFPKIKDSTEGGIMLFISSYFEYVRLRNYLKSQNASFCVIADYTEPSNVSRARVGFFERRKKMMLYTERFHFFHRYKIRGIKNLIIYSLPERKEFYPEVVNMLEESDNMTCTVLFSQFDQLRLERIVGTAAARRMVKSEKDVFLFC